MNQRRFRAGDRVLVRSSEEILSTLDADGTLDGVPYESLDLKPGDLVRVESRAQIVKKLDHKSCNRGMSIWHEMTRCL